VTLVVTDPLPPAAALPLMKGEINITNQRASLSPFQGRRTV